MALFMSTTLSENENTKWLPEYDVYVMLVLQSKMWSLSINSLYSNKCISGITGITFISPGKKFCHENF